MSSPRPPHDRPVDLSQLLAVGLSEAPESIALESVDERMTWQELDEASRSLAAGFGEFGLRPGDRIASLMPNGLPVAVLYLACIRAGLVMTPLNYRYTASNIDHALEVSQAAALVVHAERADDVAGTRLASSLPLGIVSAGGDFGGTTLEGLRTMQPADSILAAPAPCAPAGIFFTSGSTGPAKGVTHSYDSLGWMTTIGARAFEVTAADVFLPASSMSHLGSILCMLSSFAVGARVLVARRFDATEVLSLLRLHRPTILSMIPAALTAMIRDPEATVADFASLRLCRIGADTVSANLHEEFTRRAGCVINEGYGMTEVGIVALNPPSSEIRRGSIGLAAPGVDVRLVDNDGCDVATADVGRILIRSRSQMTGYWRDPNATAEVIIDGWVDSGDLARADDDGYLWFVGRSKQIIVHDGSNISPHEVERALVEHPAVDLVAVVGMDDAVHGENVRAYVTLVGGTTRPTAHELIEFAREQVGYRAPAEVVFLESMPLNATGKIDRIRLKRFAPKQPHLSEQGESSGG